jgi:hypothetical protein
MQTKQFRVPGNGRAAFFRQILRRWMSLQYQYTTSFVFGVRFVLRTVLEERTLVKNSESYSPLSSIGRTPQISNFRKSALSVER